MPNALEHEFRAGKAVRDTRFLDQELVPELQPLDCLSVGRLAVYTMLEQGIIPAIRLGRRWIVTRHAFENWERTCGMPTGFQREPEHKVT
ncbi:MAG: helix-turn-helix domain-containing protein [Bryobacteraceae bacterium]